MYDMQQVVSNYNILTNEITKDLEEQYKQGRIKGPEYAEVYHKLMSQCLQHAFQTPLMEAQTETEQARTKLTDAQKADQEYVTDKLRPLEAAQRVAETGLSQANIELTRARTADQEYMTQYIRPFEKEIAAADLNIKTKQAALAEKDILIKQQDLLIKEQQVLIAQKDLELRAEEIRLKQRQIQGFDDNLKQKLFEIQMNSWAMMFSSGMLEEKPTIIANDEVTRLYNCINPCTVRMND